MQTIACWDDLKPYGIVALTSEACGLSYRLLCDVTGRGKALLEKVFDVPALSLHENWNRGTPEAPHIGSIMLAPELFVPLAVFALLEHGCSEAWRVENYGVVGLEPIDTPDEIAAFKRHYADKLVRRFGYFGTAGDRNVHVMSSRVR